MTSEDLELGDDLRITKTTRRAAGNGTWVCGTIAGHRFDALVFPEHADNCVTSCRLSIGFPQRDT